MSALSMTSEEVVTKISQALPFHGGPAEIGRLCALAELRSYDDEAVVQRFGEPANGLWFVVRGLMELRRNLASGRKFVYNLVFPGGLADPTPVLDGLDAPFDFVVCTPSVLVHVPLKAYQRLIGEFPMLERSFIQHLCFARRLNVVRLGVTALLSPRSQITRLLVYWARFLTAGKVIPVEMPLTLTQEDIGAFWGLSRSTVNKELTQLAKEGVIDVQYLGLIILDPVRLCAIASTQEPFDFFERTLFLDGAPN